MASLDERYLVTDESSCNVRMIELKMIFNVYVLKSFEYSEHLTTQRPPQQAKQILFIARSWDHYRRESKTRRSEGRQCADVTKLLRLQKSLQEFIAIGTSGDFSVISTFPVGSSLQQGVVDKKAIR